MHPLGTKAYLLKRYSPKAAFGPFFLRVYQNGLYAQLNYFLNFSQLLVSCLPLLAKLINSGVSDCHVAMTTEVRHTWINQFGQ